MIHFEREAVTSKLPSNREESVVYNEFFSHTKTACATDDAAGPLMGMTSGCNVS